MRINNRSEVIDLLHHFRNLDYQKKVVFYDELFGIVPFNFPSYDLEGNWINDSIKLNALVDILNLERRRLNLYEKTVVFDEEPYVFDVKPSSISQRFYLNHFILSKFLEDKSKLAENIMKELSGVKNSLPIIEKKLHRVDKVIEKCRQMLETNESSLRKTFVRIFYSGFIGNDKELGVKRKYLELFLYSQGVLFAEYQLALNNARKDFAGFPRNVLDLPSRISLLHELGILQMLRDRFSTGAGNNIDNDLAEIICLISSEAENKEEVLNYLSALGKGTGSDPLNKLNLQVVAAKLPALNISGV